jgi:AmmeMemoRadiSam system protein B
MSFKRIQILLFLIFSISVISLGFSFVNQNELGNNNSKSVLAVTKDSYNLPEFEKELFDKNITKAKANPYEINQKIIAAVIPHHATSGFMIADLFQKASAQGVEKIIIIGPNHEEKGSANLLTTDSNWLTPAGILNTNSHIVNSLIKTGSVKKDIPVFEEEQSVYVLTPYIKTFLPDSDIIPIIVKKNTSLQEEINLVNNIESLIDEKTLIVASVDFSHYLDKLSADQKDQQTIELIKKQDLASLHNLTSDNLDSPSAISIMLQLMNKLAKKEMKVVDHKNSDEIQGTKTDSTTSYYYLTFH